MEQLFLRSLLLGNELYVVEQQRRRVAITLPPAFNIALLERGDQLVHEQLGRNARYSPAATLTRQSVADGVEQVRLADAARAVNEQRIVAPRRNRHDRVGGAHRELIAPANFEPGTRECC